MKSIVLLFTFFAASIGNAGYSQKQHKVILEDVTQGYKVGDKAADFKMKNVDGEMYSLASIKDTKGYIVIFTSNTCPFAVAYEERMIDLHNRMAAKGYPIIAINSNDPKIESGDSFDEMVKHHKELQFPFLYLKDDKDAVYRKFGANKTPHVFLLDKELVVRYIGAIDDSAREPQLVEEKYVENAIAALEKGETPDPSMTKAIGCPIKTAGSGKGRRGGPPSPEKMIEQMDSNGDKVISKDEAKGPLSKDFDSLDGNSDGKLTLDELSKMKKRGRKK